MHDLGDLYDKTRKELASFVSTLSPDELALGVPATPGWKIRDVVAHLVANVDSTLRGVFPSAFFANIGAPETIATVNDWTAENLAARSGRAISEILAEWDELAPSIVPMMRGDAPFPEAVPPVAPFALVTDLAVHQQDIYGALGLVRGRDDAPVKVGLSSYIGALGLRVQSDDPVLELRADRRSWTTGPGEPAATVSATRFELFRALSGRRSPDQIRALDWTGDPEPFIALFYPYGVREDALIE